METFIKQKEEYNIYKKLPKSRLILHKKDILNLDRNNGQSFNLEKHKKRKYNEYSLLKKINSHRKLLALNNNLYNNIFINQTLDLPFNIKLLYKCKKYLKSLDGERIKERDHLKLNKLRTISENNNNTKDNTVTNNGNDISQKQNEKNGKNISKLNPINFIKTKYLNNNIRTLKHNDKKFRFNLILNEKDMNNLSEYSNKNKQKIIFESKNNLTSFLKENLSNKSNKISQTDNLLNLSKIPKVDNSINNFHEKKKEDNNIITNISSIVKKQSILLHPIKNIKTFSVNTSLNNNKITNISDILIPKLENNNNILEKDVSIDIQKNNQNLQIKTKNNFQKENSLIQNIPKNKIHLQIRKSDNNLLGEKIYTKIFNTNTINDISTIDAKNEKGDNFNNKLIQETNFENGKTNIDEEGNNNFKRLFKKKNKTKIRDFFPAKKYNNKFLDKIQLINGKYPNKDNIITHQIKINKKAIIESQSHKISKFVKKEEGLRNKDSDFKQEIEMIKSEYVEFIKNNKQDLDNMINNSNPINLNNKLKSCYLSSILVQYIFLMNEFSSIFLPIVDISEKRKSFMTFGKLYLINQQIKVFDDKKSKSIIINVPKNDDIYQRFSLRFISKELFILVDDTTPDIYLEHNVTENNEDTAFLSPKKYFTTKSILRLGKGRSTKKRKKLTLIEKMTISPSMNKNGIKPISILEKEEFFEIKKKNVNNKDNKLRRRRNSIVDSNLLKSFAHKPLDYINILKQFKNKGNYFENLEELIKRGEILLFIEYFNDYSNKININQQDEKGNTLLILAIKQGLNTICKLLLKNGIDINIQNDNGNSALHYALSGKNFIMADELRKLGAVENCKNKIGLSPWDCIGKNIDE